MRRVGSLLQAYAAVQREEAFVVPPGTFQVSALEGRLRGTRWTSENTVNGIEFHPPKELLEVPRRPRINHSS